MLVTDKIILHNREYPTEKYYRLTLITNDNVTSKISHNAA